MLTHEEINQIRTATHADPFSVLGLHRDAAGVWNLRVFLPGAAQVLVIEVQSAKVRGMLVKRHEDGLFEGVIKTDVNFAYRLQVRWTSGEHTLLEDPYRFPPLLGDADAWLLAEGNHRRPYDVLGARLRSFDDVAGVAFTVWAPNAAHVSVVGDFNQWDSRRHAMRLRPECGVWEIFVPGVSPGATYKYQMHALDGRLLPLKSDPYALQCELTPKTSSVVAGLPPKAEPSTERRQANAPDAPISIYEVHAASWRRQLEPGRERWLTWKELGDTLIPYVRDLGFTHLQLMPVMEHQKDESCGYQPTALFAPTARFGTPADFRRFVLRCHDAGIGLLLDWVPAHFTDDVHGLSQFDGTSLYERADAAEGTLPSYAYGRREVANFLASSALYWLERYGVDGLRVDAIGSMVERDEGTNPDITAFLATLNDTLDVEQPGAIMVAEVSTPVSAGLPAVSRPTSTGGLGFDYRWNLRWMHDTLNYMQRDPMHRPHHHGEMTSGPTYAFSENFVLPLSHDELAQAGESLLDRMPGDRWQRFANLRAYYGFMYGHPGKKLLFMGSEFAQERAWNFDSSLDWHLLGDPLHEGVQKLVHDLNHLYRESPALYEQDCLPQGFEWIDHQDAQRSVLSFIRRGKRDRSVMVVICNFAPAVHYGFRVPVPAPGRYVECMNTDSIHYGGSNLRTSQVWTEDSAQRASSWAVVLTLPPLATVMLEWRP